MLCLVEHITWEVIIAFLIAAFAVNIVYGLYQVIGLYYYYIFKDKSQKNTWKLMLFGVFGQWLYHVSFFLIITLIFENILTV